MGETGKSREHHGTEAEIGPARVKIALRAEQCAGLALAMRARLVAGTIVAVWLAIDAPAPLLYYLEAVVVALVLSAVLQYRLALSRRARPWVGYALITFDVSIIAYASTVLSAAMLGGLPPQMVLREANTGYLALLLALTALGYAPRLMAWAGFAAASAWAVAVLWVMSQPGSRIEPPAHPHDPQFLAQVLDPAFVDVGKEVQNIIVTLLLAGILSVVVSRSRRLLMREVASARERANLARYFSPNMVDELAGHDQPLGPGRRQDVAVLFADLVGFTALSERLPPEAVLELLRDFHRRMELVVFEHGGTLEKFIGDALLATFGVPRPGPADAVAALAGARAMHAGMKAWQAERAARAAAPVALGIGIHYGPAVLGDIGSERTMSFAVVGDTTNVASRLQTLTRDFGCTIVASDRLVQQARTESPMQSAALLDGFVPRDDVALRGRSDSLKVWMLPDD